MKILFLTNQLNVGGIETNLVRLTEELVQRGHEVVAATGGGTLVAELERAGGKHRPIPFSLRPARFLRAVRDLRHLLSAERPDVVHCFSASTTPAAALALGRRGRRTSPLVTSVMGLKNSPRESFLITYARVYLTTVGADKVLVIAPAIAEVLGRLPVGSRRLTNTRVVGVSIPRSLPDGTERAELRAGLGVSPDDRVVMTMGNLEPRKSHELFIRAAALALQKVPNVRFFVIGGGPLKDTLQREVDATGRGDRIELADERSDGAQVVAAADVYVRPGVVEGFVGITVLEAQAAGVPVISFETEDVKLAIDDDETGVLVINGDVGALATAMVELLTDDARRARIAERALAKVGTTFSIATVVDGLLAIYEGGLRSDNNKRGAA